MKFNGKPIFNKLIVELHSNCNRNCHFCNRQGDDSGMRLDSAGNRIIKSMPTENALNIMDQAVEMGFSGLVGFHQWSEAFLDRRIIEMAVEARKRGLRPYVHTNGDVLRKNSQLAKSTAELFEYLVVGLYDYKNEAELAAEKEFWQNRLRGTQVFFSELGHVRSNVFAPFDGVNAPIKILYPHGPCLEPSERFIVHYDGNVSLCCEDMKAEFSLGNAFETPIREIWYSPKYRRIVKNLKKGLRQRYPLCAVCPVPPPQNMTIFHRIISRVRWEETAAGL